MNSDQKLSWPEEGSRRVGVREGDLTTGAEVVIFSRKPRTVGRLAAGDARKRILPGVSGRSQSCRHPRCEQPKGIWGCRPPEL